MNCRIALAITAKQLWVEIEIDPRLLLKIQSIAIPTKTETIM